MIFSTVASAVWLASGFDFRFAFDFRAFLRIRTIVVIV